MFFYHMLLHTTQIVTITICYAIRKGICITFP